MSTSTTPAIGLIATDEPAAAGLALRKRAVHFESSKKDRLDARDVVERMVDEEKKKQQAASAGLKVDAIGFDPPLVSEDGGPADQDERILRAAQALIREERYDEAIESLAELLGRRPDHAEAIYLTAYCQAHRSDDEEAATEAARTLRPLRPNALDQTLAIRVAELRDAIRARRFVPVIDQLMALTEADDDRVPFLREELALDPTFALLYGALVGDLVSRCDFEEAIEAADEAVEVLPKGEQETVRMLRERASGQLAALVLEPVRDLYRQGKFVAAYTALVKVDTHRDTRLFGTFEAYLRDLSGGATGFWRGLIAKTSTPAEVRPIGEAAALDELGFFICRPDLDVIRADKGEENRLAAASRAEASALTGTRHAPWFPFIHFMYAECVFARLVQAGNSGKASSLDAIESDLLDARSHYEIAATDKEIEAAEAGLTQVDEALAQVRAEKRMRAEREQEIRNVNAAVEEFNATLRSVSGGLRGPDDYQRVRTKLEGMRTTLPRLLRELKIDRSRKPVTELIEAVQSHLAALDKLKPRMEDDKQIETLVAEFKVIMDNLTGHRISVQTARTTITGLIQRAAGLRKKLKTDEGRKNLDAVTSQVREVVKMFPPL
jgi:tetratricopeptide (TPR) repeat protein